MPIDPIVAEVRRVRVAFAERFAGDLEAMAADIRKREPATAVDRSRPETDDVPPLPDFQVNVNDATK